MPTPPACVGLVSAGWEVEGRRCASLWAERPLAACAVCRAAPAVSGPLGSGTAAVLRPPLRRWRGRGSRRLR